MTNLTDTIKAWQENGTEGPWCIGRHSETSVSTSDSRGIAACGGYSDNRVDAEVLYQEHVNNTNLIAQAPHMARVVMAAIELEKAISKMYNTDGNAQLLNIPEALTAFKEAVNDE